MHRLVFRTLLAILALAAAAQADDWSKTYELTGKPELRVAAWDADVRIDTWDQNKIEVHVTTHGWHIGSGGLEIVEHQQGNAVEIELRRRHHAHVSFSVETRGAEMEIHMPRSAKADVKNQDGGITVHGLAGELAFDSSDGKIELTEVDGSLRIHTSDGPVRASGRFDAIDLHSSDGHVELDARPGSQLKQPWEIWTSDGSVKLSVPGDMAADVELHTSDGRITTNIPIEVEGRFDKSDVRGKMNGGGNRLTVHTSDGSITLDKA